MHDTAKAIDALHSIPPDIDRESWVRVAMAANAAGVGFDDFDAWSAGAGNYNAAASRDVWRSIKPGKGVGAGTLFRMAAENGWRMSEGKPQQRAVQAPRKAAEPLRKPAPGMSPAEVWERCEPATAAHGYIAAKAAAGVPLDGLRVVPAGDGLRIAGQNMAGALVVPALAADGALQSLQLIPPPGGGKKLNLPGAAMAGASFTVGEVVPGAPVALCEGVGTAWACWQATGHPAVACFGWGNVGKVAEALRQREPAARLVLVPDVGKEESAAEIAQALQCAVAYMPQGEVQNFDANDLAQRDGHDVLAALLEDAREPAPPGLPLSVAFADELPEAFTPPDELVEGVLTAGDGSVLYGDSNSGKTFFVIDMAAAVARGARWMGRNTEPGLVVYLAAESPASVRGRLQAYQRHHGVRVPNFAIVQSPIDLFDGDADTEAVIAVVRQLERQRGQKVRLIVGDTLARLSAGANENAGQDMGLVVRRFDRIRTACNAHFLLIHHSGKAAANGARGWSGIRAAVDTEIEVTDSPTGRCAEITKQRDLSTKGERIGFRLDTVTLGTTKWGAAATSCVVVPADAPDKPQGKRVSEVGGAVLEYLRTQPAGKKKREVVEHFQPLYDKSAVYRELKKLVTAGQVLECIGIVTAASEVRNGAN
ncbi:AAA family ATPase [Alicycliphilus denitrificans]|uniref:AAA family ATPase n=1 Tax=Alicycliphilus denitrificans TaxID=179636 RepID=UPI0001D9E8A4|nr:AAA family ATPase [Alicycliphilus denitrificans]ADU99331.1 Primase 2 [Alicycliphilus denitrificans BC]